MDTVRIPSRLEYLSFTFCDLFMHLSHACMIDGAQSLASAKIA